MTQRTYWHLEALKRRPTDYEIATSRLLYYVERGFEVQAPLAGWYTEHQAGSPLRCPDWEGFADPRETTYTKYVELQKNKELFVSGLFQSMEDTGYDRTLTAGWLDDLGRLIGPLRHAGHGLQMAAAYVGQMAPSGRIVVTALFQAADEMRRVQRLAYRTRVLQNVRPDFAADARERWQSDPMWQPLREAIERLLVAYDWGEAFAALNLALKPMVDHLFLIELGRLAQARGDDLLARVFLSLDEDAQWQRAWTAALTRHCLALEPDNRTVLSDWMAVWQPRALAAVDAFLPAFGDDAPAVRARGLAAFRACRAACGLD